MVDHGSFNPGTSSGAPWGPVTATLLVQGMVHYELIAASRLVTDKPFFDAKAVAHLGQDESA